MPKSKEQKQQEAIERKRTLLPGYRQDLAEAHTDRCKWMKLLSETSPRDRLRQRYERELSLSEARLQSSVERLNRLCAELKCDTHGNPLPT